LALGVIAAAFFILRLSAHAQEPSPISESEKRERIIIQDEYHPNAETEGAWRVEMVTKEVIEKGGSNTPVEGLRQLPFFVGNVATENDSNGGDGSAFINLYGLGSNNVLTLINGRRAFGFSDINAIPIAALSRVEIVDTGFSGSDSTTGVVNFITLNGPGEKPYEGAELFALYGNTTDTDAHVRQVYLRGGVIGLDGKVSIAVAGEYYSRANLFSRDREISKTGDASNDATG
jgi:outer membrane cobalamin receptor